MIKFSGIMLKSQIIYRYLQVQCDRILVSGHGHCVCQQESAAVRSGLRLAAGPLEVRHHAWVN